MGVMPIAQQCPVRRQLDAQSKGQLGRRRPRATSAAANDSDVCSGTLSRPSRWASHGIVRVDGSIPREMSGWTTRRGVLVALKALGLAGGMVPRGQGSKA
jgi:hypothetical protein